MANLFSFPTGRFWDDIQTNDYWFKWTILLIFVPLIVAHIIYTNIPGQEYTSVLFIIFGLISIVFAAMEYQKSNSKVFNFYGLGDNTQKVILGLIAGAALAFLVLGGKLFSVIPIPFAVIGPTLSLTWVWVVIFSPILETIFFRGTLFPVLKLWFNNPYLALIVASGTFAIYHYVAYGASLSAMEGAFVFSGLMILGNQALRSISFEFGFHFINNYLAFGG